jgi:2-polyprenyl-3-methyl-5-hydroxy-6-metoxy-1,4-benzoquinol methylase
LNYGPFTLKSYPCPLCGSATSTIVETKRGRAVPLDFSIVSCSSCEHVRVDPRIPDERLDELYDEAYYRGDGFDATIDYSAPPTAATLAENADIIESIAEAAGGSIRGLRWLDIGCGTGTLLEQARDRGASVVGFDSSAAARESCGSKGLTLLNVASLEAEPQTFDIVTAIEVIEHVPDPLGFLKFLTARARKGGIVFVRTGNWNLVRRLPGTPYLMPEGHIQYFTPPIMRRLFSQASLAETRSLNRTWFVWRLVPNAIRRSIPAPAFKTLAAITRKAAPAFADFPIGVT